MRMLVWILDLDRVQTNIEVSRDELLIEGGDYYTE